MKSLIIAQLVAILCIVTSRPSSILGDNFTFRPARRTGRGWQRCPFDDTNDTSAAFFLLVAARRVLVAAPRQHQVQEITQPALLPLQQLRDAPVAVLVLHLKIALALVAGEQVPRNAGDVAGDLLAVDAAGADGRNRRAWGRGADANQLRPRQFAQGVCSTKQASTSF